MNRDMCDPKQVMFLLGSRFFQGKMFEGQFVFLKCIWPKGSVYSLWAHSLEYCRFLCSATCCGKELTPGGFCFLLLQYSLHPTELPVGFGEVIQGKQTA